MNKYQDSLDNFVKALSHFTNFKSIHDWKSDLQELVDRDTPKKPDIPVHNGFCPNCHQAFGLERTRQAMIRPRWFSFCPYCGQAIDWGANDE